MDPTHNRRYDLDRRIRNENRDIGNSMKIGVVLPRGMQFSPEGATSIDIVARDLMLASRYRNTSFIVGNAVDNPFADVDFRPVQAKGQAQMIDRAVDELRNARPDLVVVHQHPESAARIADALTDIPVVLHRHGLLKHKRGFFSRWNKGRHFSSLAGLIFVSDFIRSDFLKAHPQLADKSRVVFNGVDPDVWAPAREKDQTIVYVGRAREDKGVLELFETFQNLSIPGWTLKFILGVQTEIEAHIAARLEAACDPAKTVNVLRNEPSSAVRDHLARASIAALPSIVREGFPRALVEAMSCGCATIATRRGGTPEAAGNAVLLLEVAKDQDLREELRSALIELTSDADHRARLAAASRKHVLDNLSIDAVANRYDDVLQNFARESS